jgi:predicted transcriptional regulator
MAKKIIIDPEILRDLAEKGLTTKEIAKELGAGRSTINSKLNEYNIPSNKPPIKKHTSEAKKIMSEKRKKWLKDNPEKHPWKKHDKFKSVPCENVKKFLDDLQINYIGEYDPEIDDRFFSIDIALPDKMIALEINGNQHYERSGKLKPYYQDRHDLLVNRGWDVYEIHYSACFNLEKWSEFIDKLKNSESIVEFDYFNYVPRKKKYYPPRTHGTLKKAKYDTCDCGNKKTACSKKCRKCASTKSRPKHRKAERPSKEELEKLIWEYPFTTLGKMYGVSDVAVKKWCKCYGIVNFPPTGYFLRK